MSVGRFTTRPELVGTFGMVSSTHWLASSAGMGVLERGGNAFDAAVTAGFVLQVVEPHLNGPGGEVVLLAHDARSAKTITLCGQGPSPRGATVQQYRDRGFNSIPGTGLWAACVPGAFDGWMEVLSTFGTLNVREVLEPAILYAVEGYPLVSRISGSINASKEVFLRDWPSSAQIYLPGGRVPLPGSRFSNVVLAQTYMRIVREAEGASNSREGQIEAARTAFYQGFVADQISEFVSTTPAPDGTGTPGFSLLDYQDLAAYRARLEPTRTFEFHGLEVHKAGQWSQGPAFLQQLALLEGYDLAAMGHNSVEYVHTLIEATKLALADRDAWYGDPDAVPDRVDALLDSDYTAQRRALIGDKASHELRPGWPNGHSPRLIEASPGEMESIGSGEPTVIEYQPPDGDTCQVDVVDSRGNMVAATPSGGWLQASPAIPSLGFGLGTRLQMAWLDESHPGGLGPSIRPRTTLSPTIVTREGFGELAFGTPGGDGQDQWTLYFFLSVVEFGMNLQEAIDAVMFSTNHMVRSFAPRRSEPGTLVIEGRASSELVDGLKQRGHLVTISGDWSLGRISAIGRDPVSRMLRAAANPRGMQSYAVGR